MNVPTVRRSALHTMGRGRRRVLVLVMQLGMTVWALAFAFGEANSWWLLLPILCSQALYMVIFFRVLRPIMREVIKKASDLDERQIAVRNRAHYGAYQVFATVVVTVAAAPMVASLYFGVEVPLQLTHWHFQGLFLFFTNLCVSLPASVIAWTEPDPDE